MRCCGPRRYRNADPYFICATTHVDDPVARLRRRHAGGDGRYFSPRTCTMPAASRKTAGQKVSIHSSVPIAINGASAGITSDSSASTANGTDPNANSPMAIRIQRFFK